MNKESIIKPIIGGLIPLGILTLTGLLVSGAFSDRVRKLIHQRDHTCQGVGEHVGILEAAHINHNRSYPQYNSETNGQLLCTQHHLLDHQSGRMNGLNEHQNNWAIDAIAKRLNAYIAREDEP